MSNAKFLAFDTPNTKKPLSSGVLNAKIFCMSKQYNLKYGSIRIRMVKVLLFFYSLFSLLSHHFILFFFSHLSFFLRHSYQPLIFSSFTLFSSHCRCFSLFLLALLRHLLNLMSISIAVVFFFFLSDLMGVFGSGWVQTVMGRSVMVGCNG